MLYNFFEKGFLPDSGGLLDQDNFLMEQINIVASTVHKIEKERHARQK